MYHNIATSLISIENQKFFINHYQLSEKVPNYYILNIPEDPAFCTGGANFFKCLFLLVKASSNLESNLLDLFNREMDEDSTSVLFLVTEIS